MQKKMQYAAFAAFAAGPSNVTFRTRLKKDEGREAPSEKEKEMQNEFEYRWKHKKHAKNLDRDSP